MYWNIVWNQSFTSDMFGGVFAPKGKTVGFPVLCPQKGTKIRIRLCNERGKKPYRIGKISIVKNGKVYPVTLNGKREIVVPVHTSIYTDETAVPVESGERIQIRLYLVSKAMDINVSENEAICWKGDAVDNPGLPCLPQKTPPFIPAIDRVEILSEKETKIIAAFGDSITAMGHWVKPLAKKIYEEYDGQYVLLNAGISGNCMTSNWEGSSFANRIFSKVMGQKGTVRFERDVMQLENLHTVIFALGINDVANMCLPGQKQVTLENLEKETLRLAKRAKDRGAKIVIHTLTPFKGSANYTEERNRLRIKYNEWVNTVGREFFDYVVDCVPVLAEDSDPSKMKEELQQGDHLHPNPQGGLAMAGCYDISKII